jgi:hypothetical protein
MNCSILVRRALLLAKLPRRRSFRARMENQISIWLSHDACLGVKWKVTRCCGSRRNASRAGTRAFRLSPCYAGFRPDRATRHQDERLVSVLEHREKRRASSRRRNNPRLACRELSQLGPLTRPDPGGALIEMGCALGSGVLVFIVPQETRSVWNHPRCRSSAPLLMPCGTLWRERQVRPRRNARVKAAHDIGCGGLQARAAADGLASCAARAILENG